MSGAVALQLIRHQLPWRVPLPLQQLAKEPFGLAGVTMSLNQDVDHALVHCPPQVVALAPNLHEHLTQVPHVTQATLAALELPCMLGTELPDHCLMVS